MVPSSAFLVNRGRLPLGAAQDGREVKDVALPPWAENSPSKFVAGMRSALEHSYTSLHLHDWFDLIFGRKHRGAPLAVESANVFFALCYGDQVDLDAIENPKLRARYLSHFGQARTVERHWRPVAPCPVSKASCSMAYIDARRLHNYTCRACKSATADVAGGRAS